MEGGGENSKAVDENYGLKFTYTLDCVRRYEKGWATIPPPAAMGHLISGNAWKLV
jgi:hypothetical protein